MRNFLLYWIYRPYAVFGLALTNVFFICVPILVYFLMIATQKDVNVLDRVSQLPEWMMISAFLYWEYIRDVRNHYSQLPNRSSEELAAMIFGVIGLIASSVLLARSIEGFYFKSVELSEGFYVLQWVVFGGGILLSIIAKLFVVWRTQTESIQAEERLTNNSSGTPQSGAP
jgi:hypothetical protein